MKKFGKLAGLGLLAVVAGLAFGIVHLKYKTSREGIASITSTTLYRAPVVSKEADKRHQEEKAGLLKEIESLKNKLTEHLSLKAEMEKLKAGLADLDKLRQKNQELKAKQAQMETLQAQIDELNSKLAASKPLVRYSEPIFFRLGRTSVHAAGHKIVGRTAGDIKATPNPEVAVEGHADKTPMNPRGRKIFGDNLGISVVRSLSVARELFARGVDVERVVVIGYGDSRPLKDKTDDKKPVNNRRAVIRYQPAQAGSSTAP